LRGDLKAGRRAGCVWGQVRSGTVRSLVVVVAAPVCRAIWGSNSGTDLILVGNQAGSFRTQVSE
jgi:hypothetical protein